MLKILLHFWNQFKAYIVLVLCTLISLFALSNNNSPSIKNVRTIAFSSFALFTNFISNFTNTSIVTNENEKLREMNAKLMLQVNLLRQYGLENKDLKKLLALKDTTSFPLVSAAVVSKSLDYKSNLITVNVGEIDGVKSGMPVINYEGFIGIVYTVSKNYSLIRTLKNIELKIAVKDERSRLNGLLLWNGKNLELSDIPKNSDIKLGDRIVTSDISTIIPVSLPIGYVKEINVESSDIFNIIEVAPFVNLSSVENLFILKITKSVQVKNFELNFYIRGKIDN